MKRSDVVWFGRACVWMGIVMLLFMAFTGVQVGPITAFSVVAVAIGIALLLYTIPWKSGANSRWKERSDV